MKFEVTEIKKLGSGLGQSLSVRLEKVEESQCAANVAQTLRCMYTIHAVLPFWAEFSQIQIGQVFDFSQDVHFREPGRS